MKELNESPSNLLCKSCGLCCSGHLFLWTKLRSAELNSIESLGLKVHREPNQRGFNQPCPLWDGVCTIYTTSHYPDFCRTYKCKLLKELINESVSLPSALELVGQAKELIHELELNLPESSILNFRERLENFLEQNDANSELYQKSKRLLEVYKTVFGVTMP